LGTVSYYILLIAAGFVRYGELDRLHPNPNVLVAASKGLLAVKLCTNKILQFLTGGAG